MKPLVYPGLGVMQHLESRVNGGIGRGNDKVCYKFFVLR